MRPVGSGKRVQLIPMLRSILERVGDGEAVTEVVLSRFRNKATYLASINSADGCWG